MKFRCEACGAQYAIADEKVGKKGVKVKCKKCGEVITVRPGAPAAAAAPTAAEVPPAEPTPEEQREPTAVDRSGVDAGAPASAEAGAEAEGGGHRAEEELRSALDNILGDEPPGGGNDQGDQEEDGDLDRASTRVFNVEEMQQVQAEREKAVQTPDAPGDSFASLIGGAPDSGLAPAEPAAAPADRERVEWYAAVDDQQVGPMSLEDFAGRVGRGELDQETLVWKTGFTDWLPATEVPEVNAVLAEGSALQDEASAAEAPAGSDEETGGWSPRASTGGGWGQEDVGAASGDRRASEDPDAFGGGLEDEGDRGTGDDASEPGDHETSSAASSQAFAGADVDWKPSAISALSSLAEEELAGLRPSDPEPEPKAEEDALLGGSGEDDGPTGDMDDGDSSLIGQIAAEEETKARQAEFQRQEEERAAELMRQREEEEAAAAQAAAKKEQYQERVERAAPPPGQYVPPRAVVPKWAIYLMAGGGAMLLLLVGAVGYILASSKNQPDSERGQMQPIGPAERVTPQPVPAQPNPVEPAPRPATEVAPAPAPGEPGAAQPAVPAEGSGVQPAPGPNPVAVAGVQPAPVPGEPGTVKPATAPIRPKPIKPVVKRNEPKPPTPGREPPKGRDDFAEEDEPIPSKPEEAPKPVKASGKGLLDFEDEDDRALAADMGIKKEPVKGEPATAPVKKDLPPLTNGDVLEVMKQHIEEFKACNKEQKKRDASVQGKMVVNFTIQPDGKVSTIGLDAKTAEFKGTFVADCISRTIKGIRFPAFGGGPKSVPFPFTVK